MRARTQPRAPRPRWIAAALSLAAATAAAADPPTPTPVPPRPTPAASASPAPAARLAVVDRTVAQGRGDWQFWQVDYKLRNVGGETLTIRPAELSATIDGWVSNSRVAAHAAPRRSNVTVTGTGGLQADAEVVASADADRRCRERAVVQAWAGRDAEPPDPIAKAVVRLVAAAEQPAIEVAPGGDLRVRVRLDHVHHLYGPYDPLLGRRTLELHLGAAGFRDTLPLDRPHHAAPPEPAWPPAPPDDRVDRRVALDPGGSLHLEAHVPGNQSYHFPERPVRYGTAYRLSYSYLIAPGGEGDCVARVSQYRNTSSWRCLPDGDHEQALAVVGRWTRVEKVIRTEPEATHLRLEFRILRAEVGEMWIDDIELEPINEALAGP